MRSGGSCRRCASRRATPKAGRPERRAAVRAAAARPGAGAVGERAGRADAHPPEQRLGGGGATGRAGPGAARAGGTRRRRVELSVTARARRAATGRRTRRRRGWSRRFARLAPARRRQLAASLGEVAHSIAGSERAPAMFFEERRARSTEARVHSDAADPSESLGDFTATPRRAADRRCSRSASASSARYVAMALLALIAPLHQPVLLPALRSPPLVSPADTTSAWSDRAGAGGRRADHRPDGALRLGAHPRPRHPRGDRGDPDQRQPRRAARSRCSSRCRRRSRSAPAARSAPRGRSS